MRFQSYFRIRADVTDVAGSALHDERRVDRNASCVPSVKLNHLLLHSLSRIDADGQNLSFLAEGVRSPNLRPWRADGQVTFFKK
jgi:hypothetical protein